MIGNERYVGKGLAADTLKQFMTFMREVDPSIDMFIIDPSQDNPRAKRVYEKAGFTVIDTYITEKGYFKGDVNFLMQKTFSSNYHE
jgi:RimJ/RimL family protein N-acetyltransferase